MINVFFFKQKTAYEMRISDWSSDVCSSDLSIAELGEAQIELATLKANAANFERQMVQMREAREEMLAQFKAVGGEVLSRSQDEFLKRAEDRFKQSEEAGEQKIKELLSPVGERLKKTEEQVETQIGRAHV